MSKTNKINTLALTLLITGSIDSIRNLPANALFGSSLIFFFSIAAIVFLIPTALVSAELASNIDKEGGIYQWVRTAFGEKIGFLAVWLQWVNNIVWFPTILSFIAGTAIYLINPGLAQNKVYMMGSVLAVFWVLTLINLRGIRVSAKFTSFCTIAGLILPMTLIITLMVVWLFLGKPVEIHLTGSNIIPDWHQPGNWSLFNAAILSFAGMELATVHIHDVNNPQKTFPKALAFSALMILSTMVLGSLAIAFIVPSGQINLVNGTIQSFSYFLSAYHLGWLTPILTILLIIGSMGGLVSWIVSPVKGMAQAANHGFLPPAFGKNNNNGVPQNLMLVQAVLVSLACLSFMLFPSINGSYWFLSVLSTQMYILMYVLMFLAAFQLRKLIPYGKKTFRIPGKQFGLGIVCLLGLIGCALTLLTGFIPPEAINVGSTLRYVSLFSIGMIGMTLPVLFFYLYKARNDRRVAADAIQPDAEAVLETN